MSSINASMGPAFLLLQQQRASLVLGADVPGGDSSSEEASDEDRCSEEAPNDDQEEPHVEKPQASGNMLSRVSIFEQPTSEAKALQWLNDQEEEPCEALSSPPCADEETEQDFNEEQSSPCSSDASQSSSSAAEDELDDEAGLEALANECAAHCDTWSDTQSLRSASSASEGRSLSASSPCPKPRTLRRKRSYSSDSSHASVSRSYMRKVRRVVDDIADLQDRYEGEYFELYCLEMQQLEDAAQAERIARTAFLADEPQWRAEQARERAEELGCQVEQTLQELNKSGRKIESQLKSIVVQRIREWKGAHPGEKLEKSMSRTLRALT
jgi:hypothetical protein